MNRGLCFQFAQGLDAVHDTFIGVLVNLYRDELGLPNPNDRSHDKHRLSGARSLEPRELGNNGEGGTDLGS